MIIHNNLIIFLDKSIDHFSDGHQSFCVDVKNSGQVSQLLQDVHTAFSAVPSIAVNCAGITRDQFLLKMEEEQFDEVISVNLKVLSNL